MIRIVIFSLLSSVYAGCSVCTGCMCVCAVSEDDNEGYRAMRAKPSYAIKIIVRRPALAYTIRDTRATFCAAPDTVAGCSQC